MSFSGNVAWIDVGSAMATGARIPVVWNVDRSWFESNTEVVDMRGIAMLEVTAGKLDALCWGSI